MNSIQMQFRWYRVNKMIYALKYESILGRILVFSQKLICKIITAQIAYFKKEGEKMSEEKTYQRNINRQKSKWPLSKWLDQDLFKPSGDKSEALFNCYSTT